MKDCDQIATVVRAAVSVRGSVQGVGFRPFVYKLAARRSLSGFVKNRADGVLIEVEGRPQDVSSFVEELAHRPPSPCRIDALQTTSVDTTGDPTFRIDPSDPAGTPEPVVPHDLATCDACLAELFDPNDRRHRHPFINCTQCGPRLTILSETPYDRARTTMSRFSMCADCRREYDDPTDRRFHAQPIACPSCGPELALVDDTGEPMGGEPIARAGELLRQGKIVAVKGLGGYHLSCDATDEDAVRRLRSRKHREEKPLALMVPDLAHAEALCRIQPRARALLASPRRPIVLLRRREERLVADAVAPGSPRLGLMLPYTPVHHLLMRELNGPLVMTSGNRSGEPIACDDPDARQRLQGIADAFLTHDRPILLGCDDSVVQVLAGAPVVLRRARGFVPEPIDLPLRCPYPILALGGHLKNTFAVGRDHRAFLSPHIGDLGDLGAMDAQARAVAHFERLFACEAKCLVHDLHPGYATTEQAQRRSSAGRASLGVQHHHAHMAGCMAENGLLEAVIGVTFDGIGYGIDGSIWGGEFLVGDYLKVRRAAHLRPVPLPGGEQAIREPWRMALAHLVDAGVDPEPLLGDRVPKTALRIARRMIDRGVNAPLASSAGRLFDAVASMLQLRDRIDFEGQAAIELECLAETSQAEGTYPIDLLEAGDRAVADTRPLIRSIARALGEKAPRADIARRFHTTLVRIIQRVVQHLRERTGLDAVVLSGGVFMNALLLEETKAVLERDRFRVFCHRDVPPNDGGLCLGQVAVAAARLEGAR